MPESRSFDSCSETIRGTYTACGSGRQQRSHCYLNGAIGAFTNAAGVTVLYVRPADDLELVPKAIQGPRLVQMVRR